jgi:hypothetical protein
MGYKMKPEKVMIKNQLHPIETFILGCYKPFNDASLNIAK